MVDPGVKFKAVEADALLANWNFSQGWSHLGVEPISVHTQIAGSIPKSNDAWCHRWTTDDRAKTWDPLKWRRFVQTHFTDGLQADTQMTDQIDKYIDFLKRGPPTAERRARVALLGQCKRLGLGSGVVRFVQKVRHALEFPAQWQEAETKNAENAYRVYRSAKKALRLRSQRTLRRQEYRAALVDLQTHLATLVDEHLLHLNALYLQYGIDARHVLWLVCEDPPLCVHCTDPCCFG